VKKLDRLSSIFWLILSVAICIHAYELGLGGFHNPGPGFLFFWSGVGLGVLSIMILLPTLKKNEEASKETQENIFENVKWTNIIPCDLWANTGAAGVLVLNYFFDRLPVTVHGGQEMVHCCFCLHCISVFVICPF
jgi:hypothetical protein